MSLLRNDSDEWRSRLSAEMSIAKYALQVVLPFVLIIVTGTAWGVRLESRADHNSEAIVELKANRALTEKVLDELKVDQVRTQGKIETMMVVIANLDDTAKRIEAKLNKE